MLPSVVLKCQVQGLSWTQVLSCKKSCHVMSCHVMSRFVCQSKGTVTNHLMCLGCLRMSQLPRTCLLITLIKCLKGHKSLGSLVKGLIVNWVQPIKGPTEGPGRLLSCSKQLKMYLVNWTFLNVFCPWYQQPVRASCPDNPRDFSPYFTSRTRSRITSATLHFSRILM